MFIVRINLSVFQLEPTYHARRATHGNSTNDRDDHACREIAMHAFLLVMLHRHLSRDLTVLTPMSYCVVHSNGIWKADQTVPNAFPGKQFSTILSPNKVLTPFEKCFPGKRIRNGLFGLPKSSFGRCIFGYKWRAKFLCSPKRRFWKAEQKMTSGFSI